MQSSPPLQMVLSLQVRKREEAGKKLEVFHEGLTLLTRVNVSISYVLIPRGSQHRTSEWRPFQPRAVPILFREGSNNSFFAYEVWDPVHPCSNWHILAWDQGLAEKDLCFAV